MDNYNSPVLPKDLGDGLLLWGGDLFCEYPLKGTDIKEDLVIYDYGVYTVVVSWTNSGSKRLNLKWQRIYPDSSGGGG